MASDKGNLKGGVAEEALRSYFNSIGYYTARGVPFEYSGYTLTDVDLFLYLKESSISRTRSNVDIKRKRTPQAMERIFWAKGLQDVLGLDSCIVSTTDKRFETVQFGRAHDVVVLDGHFMQRVLSYSPEKDGRIPEEDFIKMIDSRSIAQPNTWLKAQYEESKKLLLTELNFNGCNLLLGKIDLALQEYQVTGGAYEPAVRLFYAFVSYFLISLDYVSRSFSYRSTDERKKEMSDGFKYGESGKSRVEEISRIAVSLVEQSTSGDLVIKNGLTDELERQMSEFPAEILVEYFGKSEHQKSMFDDARYFERMAYSKLLMEPKELESHPKGIVAVICDFLRIDRKLII